MVTESIFNLLFGLVEIIIAILPDSFFELPEWLCEFMGLVTKGLSFFPPEVFNFCIKNIIFWLSIHYSWCFYEWVLKKIPGTD